jgi:hypothetical protein
MGHVEGTLVSWGQDTNVRITRSSKVYRVDYQGMLTVLPQQLFTVALEPLVTRAYS